MSILVGETVTIIAKLENSGEPISGNIHMIETSGHGSLQWNNRMTGTVSVTGEKTEAINSIAGQTQCVLSSLPIRVLGVWEVNSLGNRTGPDLMVPDSNIGRTLDLNKYLLTGTPLIVNYERSGTVVNYMKGLTPGTANIIISAEVNTEGGLSQVVQVDIEAVPVVTPPGGGDNNIIINLPPEPPTPTIPAPTTPEPPGTTPTPPVIPYTPPTGGGGIVLIPNVPDTGGEPESEWFAVGPTSIVVYGLYQRTVGPYGLRSTSGRGAVSCIVRLKEGNGYIQCNGDYITVSPGCSGQTIVIEVSGVASGGRQITEEMRVNITWAPILPGFERFYY